MFGRDPITEEAFADLLGKIFSLSEEFTANSKSNQLTTYELLTAMALYGFSSERMDFQVLEVGLGGRLDATNVIKESMVSIITPISLDHTQILGDTLEQIALEKAGILKNNSLPLIAPQDDKVLKVIDDRCRDLGLKPIHVADQYSWEKIESDIDGQSFYFSDSDCQDEFRIPLLGKCQLENAGVAIATAKLLDAMGTKIAHDAVKEGLRSVNWPGRLEVISTGPLLVVDGAHNVRSVELLSSAVREYFVFDNIIIVIGVAIDKDLPNMVNGLISLNPKIVATQSRHPRAERAEEVGRMFSEAAIDVLVVEEVAEAVNKALKMAGENDLVLATGSLYVVSEVREEVKGITREVYMNG
jgi:dihydrofolate synthase/folylpolyglutamate synthase